MLAKGKVALYSCLLHWLTDMPISQFWVEKFGIEIPLAIEKLAASSNMRQLLHVLKTSHALTLVSVVQRGAPKQRIVSDIQHVHVHVLCRCMHYLIRNHAYTQNAKDDESFKS